MVMTDTGDSGGMENEEPCFIPVTEGVKGLIGEEVGCFIHGTYGVNVTTDVTDISKLHHHAVTTRHRPITSLLPPTYLSQLGHRHLVT